MIFQAYRGHSVSRVELMKVTGLLYSIFLLRHCMRCWYVMKLMKPVYQRRSLISYTMLAHFPAFKVGGVWERSGLIYLSHIDAAFPLSFSSDQPQFSL